MRILLIANGDNVAQYYDIKKFDKVICVDGGLNCLPSSFSPDVIIGDFDSANMDKLKEFNKSIVVHKDNQDVSDLKFAIQYCLSNFNKLNEIIILNAISTDRIDHSFCNILL